MKVWNSRALAAQYVEIKKIHSIDSTDSKGYAPKDI
jgi:hypothetical protein